MPILTFVCSNFASLSSRTHAIHSLRQNASKESTGKSLFSNDDDQNDEKKKQILNRKQFLWISNACARQVHECVRVCAMEQKQTAHIWH